MLRLDISKTDLANWKKIENQLKVNIEKCDASIASADEALREPEREHAELQAELAPLVLKNKLICATLGLPNLKQGIANAKLKHAEFTAQLKDVEQQQLELANNIQLAKEKIERYTKAVELKQEQQELSHLNDEIAKLEDQLDRLRLETTELEEKIKKQELEGEAARQARNSLNMKRGLKKTSLKQLEDRAAQLKVSVTEKHEYLGEEISLGDDLPDLQARLDKVRGDRSAWVIEKNGIDLRVKELREDKAEQELAQRKLGDLLRQSELLIETAKSDGVVVQPDWKLGEIDARIAQLRVTDKEFSSKIESAKTEKREQEAKREKLHLELGAWRRKSAFINAYFNHPAELLRNLDQQLNENIARYKRENSNLNDDEIRCIDEFQNKADFIVNGAPRANEPDPNVAANLDEIKRLRIWQLTGFLYMHTNEYSARCNPLCNALIAALGDEMLLEDEARREYINVSLYYNQILDKKSNAAEVRLSAYDSAILAFREALEDEPEDASEAVTQMYAAGRYLLKTIEQKAVNQESKDAYTSVLQASTTLLKNYNVPGNHTALQNCAKLNIDGKRHIGRTVGGALLMFLGLAMIAGSIAGIVLTGGAMAPLAFGASGGMVVFGFGLAMIQSAKPTGTTKALTDYLSAASRAARKSGLLAFRIERRSEERSLLPSMYEAACYVK